MCSIYYAPDAEQEEDEGEELLSDDEGDEGESGEEDDDEVPAEEMAGLPTHHEK